MEAPGCPPSFALRIAAARHCLPRRAAFCALAYKRVCKRVWKRVIEKRRAIMGVFAAIKQNAECSGFGFALLGIFFASAQSEIGFGIFLSAVKIIIMEPAIMEPAKSNARRGRNIFLNFLRANAFFRGLKIEPHLKPFIAARRF